MTELSAAAFLALVGGRRGHFRLESGHHGGLWLDLDGLFTDQRRVEPFVTRLVDALHPHDLTAVCGPLRGGAFLAQLVARATGLEFFFTERQVPAETVGLYPARYRLPPALAALVPGKRFAILDDVMSAGSALRGTYADLRAHGGSCVVAGALLVLGRTGAGFFEKLDIPVAAVVTRDYELWDPAVCPLCSAGVPLEDVAAPAA